MPYALPHVERLSPYPVGEMPKDPSRALKLNQNESPYPPSPEVRRVLEEAAVGDGLRRYPGEGPAALRRALAVRHGVPEEMVFVGNGSSEIIALLMKVFVGPGGRAVMPDPTFGLYRTAAALQQGEAVSIPMDGAFRPDLAELAECPARLAVLVNPNSPTGGLLGKEEVLKLADRFRGLLAVDEAYMDFAGAEESVIPHLGGRSNLLVLRTFSKAYGLAGIRVGYAVGEASLIRALDKGKDIYNVSELSARIALAALEDPDHTARTVRAVISTRNRFMETLKAMGFGVYPTATNFVLCTPPSGPGRPDAEEWSRLLADRGIYVRHFDHPLLRDKLRISVGTDGEMDRLSEAMEELVRAAP